jgi:hypothetical protein
LQKAGDWFAHLHLVRDTAQRDDRPVLKLKRREGAEFFRRPRQVAHHKPRPVFHNGSLSGRLQTSRRRLAITRQASLKIAQPFMAG